MTIRVTSLDFDGCLFHMGYILSEDKDVVKSNQALFDQLIEENKAFARVVTLVGSNRQSKYADDSNSGHGKGSCFSAIQKISTCI